MSGVSGIHVSVVVRESHDEQLVPSAYDQVHTFSTNALADCIEPDPIHVLPSPLQLGTPPVVQSNIPVLVNPLTTCPILHPVVGLVLVSMIPVPENILVKYWLNVPLAVSPPGVDEG